MTPRTAKQFREIREEKKTLIMDTALRQFANEGYHNTTISHIARQAGISKGLMYNYFKSKEELLTMIINRSMEDIFSNFNHDHKENISEEEFEFFIRNIFSHIRKNLSFWRLFYQLLLQKDVRDQFMKAFTGEGSLVQKLYTIPGDSSISEFATILQKYFFRKKEKMAEGYDPVLDMNMFIYTIEGFTMVNAYLDEVDEYYDKAINKIIELYK